MISCDKCDLTFKTPDSLINCFDKNSFIKEPPEEPINKDSAESFRNVKYCQRITSKLDTCTTTKLQEEEGKKRKS